MPRHRRQGLVTVGVVLAAGGATVAGSLAWDSGGRTPVLVVAQRVPAGETLQRDDLQVAEIAGSGVTGVAAADIGAVAGQPAAVDLLPGTLLTAPMVGGSPLPGPGRALVGVTLSGGQAPLGRLVGGVPVLVVLSAAPAGGASQGSVAQVDGTTGTGAGASDTARGADGAPAPLTRVLGTVVRGGRVVDVGQDPTTGAPQATVEVDERDAVAVSQAAAGEAVSLVVLPGGGAAGLVAPPAGGGG